MTYPGVIFWVLLLWGAVSRGPVLLYLLMGSLAIGSLAVVPPSLTGGVTIQPDSVCAAVFFVKTICRPHAARWMIDAALRPQKFLLLTMFLLICVVCTIFAPDLFAGIAVMPLRASGGELAPIALHHSAANVSQMGYLSLSAGTALAFAYAAQRPGFLAQIMRGYLVCGFVLVVTGLMDITAQRLGLESLLTPFRNATYSFLIDNVVGGYQRVIGLMPEASAYGPACVSAAAVLAMLRPLYPAGVQRNLCVGLLVALLLLGFLSTSTTAFASIAMFAVIYGADWCRRAASPRAVGRATLPVELAVAGALILAAALVLAFDDALLRGSMAMLDETVFDKTGTTSYLVRSYWNAVSWADVAASYGMGVGVGSTRSSDWVVALVSNTGILGAFTLGMVFLQAFLRNPGHDRQRAGVATALKFAMIIPLAAETVSSPVPDFGLGVAILLGTIAGVSLTRSSRAATSRVRAAYQPDDDNDLDIPAPAMLAG
ncbi:MAG: hypothetical protein POH28_04550 [Acidocella sp.]|nr:hypothetical protein [Acidocella sp.]